MDAKKQKIAAWIGGMIGFVLFLMMGLKSSLLFGGHFGRLVLHAIVGHGYESTLLDKVLTGSCMVLGFLIGLFCFVFLGVIVTQGIVNLTYHGKRIDAELAENNGQLHPLPPAPTQDISSALSNPQDPKKS